MKYFLLTALIAIAACDQLAPVDPSKIRKINYATAENTEGSTAAVVVPPSNPPVVDWSKYRYKVRWVYQVSGTTQYWDLYCNNYKVEGNVLFLEPNNDKLGNAWLVLSGQWLIEPNSAFNPER